jgi:acyl-CoA reductase-like NAD-dependent aldehyde dehydrogenase
MTENYPSPPEKQSPTEFEEIDKSLDRLEAAKDKWLTIENNKRVALLNECLTDIMVLGDEWIASSCRAKGFERNTSTEGEEWISQFMPIIRNIRLLIHALNHNGEPTLPGKRQRPDGQWVASVFPSDFREKLMFSGFEAEVWIQPNKEPSQGQHYRNTASSGSVCGILGAGNSASIACMDLLYKLFVENEVSVLKMNPVNDYLGPYIIRAFRALIEGNYMTVIYGGAKVGAYLCTHDKVDSIHITGAQHTHDIIVWGDSPEEQEKNKSNNSPRLKKPITSELGCVSPCLVVPGDWKDSDIDYHARQIVSMATQNVGFNCNAPNVVVFPKGWSGTPKLLARIQHHYGLKPQRKAYYPGATTRYQSLKEKYPNGIEYGAQGSETLPWLLIPNLSTDPDEAAYSTEPFCGILSTTELEHQDAADYLSKAVEFCNQHIKGSLNITLLIDPKTKKNNEAAYDNAIANLEYGTIGVNAWDGVGYGMCSTTWGAFPKHSIEDVGSGIGVVHNSYLLDYPEKSVLSAPFRLSPTPAWFYDNKNLVSFGKALVRYESSPSWINFFRVAINALKG